MSIYVSIEVCGIESIVNRVLKFLISHDNLCTAVDNKT